MYHYVRDLKHSRYPEIKGLPVDRFRAQLQYILTHYNVIRMEDLVEAVPLGRGLPERSLLLTFDDAYKDHFDYVFPILDELGLQGSFFPPAQAIQMHRVLDVNKIHFVLASVEDKQRIIDCIYSILDTYRAEYELESNEEYFARLAGYDRFDTKEVIFIKRMLQKELPESLRSRITDDLFHEFVASDEGAFSRELYMDIDQLKCMRRHGMYIGSHGYDHYWLDTLSADQQRQEIDESLRFLESLGCDSSSWVMCYPYGAYDEGLLELLRERNCKVGLTTQVDIADFATNDPLALPRLDTNDLPTTADAPVCEWTSAARDYATCNPR